MMQTRFKALLTRVEQVVDLFIGNSTVFPLGAFGGDLFKRYPICHEIDCGLTHFAGGPFQNNRRTFDDFFNGNRVYFLCDDSFKNCVIAARDSKFVNDYYYVHKCISNEDRVRRFHEFCDDDGTTAVIITVLFNRTILETFRRFKSRKGHTYGSIVIRNAKQY